MTILSRGIHVSIAIQLRYEKEVVGFTISDDFTLVLQHRYDARCALGCLEKVSLDGRASVLKQSCQQLQRRIANVEMRVGEKGEQRVGRLLAGEKVVGMLETLLFRQFVHFAQMMDRFEDGLANVRIDFGVVL